MSENKETLEEFIDFCEDHPEMRFWQALRSWADVASVCVRIADGDMAIDTYYREGKDK
jgi:hypothetical protein